MKSVKIFTKPTCPYCLKAKELLRSLGVLFEEVDVLAHPEEREKMIAAYHWPTVPAIFIDGELIGGCDDLHALHTSGELQKKLL